MKQRTFYVVNLDRSRIAMMAMVLLGFVLIAFATGFRYGRGAQPPGPAPTDHASRAPSSEAGTTPSTDSRVMEPEIGRSEREIPRSPEESDSLVQESLRTPSGPAPASRSLAVPERRNPRDSQTGEPSAPKRIRKSRAARSRPAAGEEQSPRAHQKRRDSERGESKKSAHAPRTAMRNVAVERRLKPTTTPSERPDSAEADGSSADSYMLQLGTYRYASAAKRQAGTLKKQGFPSRIVKQGRNYRVYVGSKMSEVETSRLRAALRQKKYAPITVRLKKSPQKPDRRRGHEDR